MFFVHTRKRIKCFPSTLRRKILKTQQSHAAETLESTREHGHSKVFVEPMWRNQHSKHHFGRHSGRHFGRNFGRHFGLEEDSGSHVDRVCGSLFLYYIKHHVAVRLFNNRSQETSKCGKNISDTLFYRLVYYFVFLTTF